MTTPSGYSRSDFPIIDMGDEDLQTLLEGFDDYSQKLILAIDPCWDASNRMQSVEYCLFLYGAALGIARGKQLDDEYCVAIFGPYLSRFMDWRISTPWLLQCEAEMVKSHRLQGVRSAGANTATASTGSVVITQTSTLSVQVPFSEANAAKLRSACRSRSRRVAGE